MKTRRIISMFSLMIMILSLIEVVLAILSSALQSTPNPEAVTAASVAGGIAALSGILWLTMRAPKVK